MKDYLPRPGDLILVKEQVGLDSGGTAHRRALRLIIAVEESKATWLQVDESGLGLLRGVDWRFMADRIKRPPKRDDGRIFKLLCRA